MTDRSRLPGKRYKFQQYEFYAHQGMITLIDTEKAQDTSAAEKDWRFRIPPGEFMKRAIAAMMADPEMYANKQRELRRLLTEAKEACLLCKRQGDPTDASVLEHVVKHARKHSALVLPGDSPELPPMPGQTFSIKPKDKHSNILSKGVQVTPDLVSASGMVIPRK